MIARRMLIAALLLTCGMLLGSCASPEPEAPAEVYSARGMVRQLPSGADKTIFIHHEAIPEFRDQEGKVVGMDAMAMPFPVVDTQLLEGLAVGDRVSFEFEISWTGSPPMALRKIDKLPADTPLTLTAPADESEESASDSDEGGDPMDHSGHAMDHSGDTMYHSGHTMDHSEHAAGAEDSEPEDHSGH